MDKDLKISVVGLNIKTAPINDLEFYQIPRKEFVRLLRLFASQVGVEGVVFLSTCNRCEIYISHNNFIKPFELVANFYKDFLNKEISNKKNLFYVYSNKNAIEHLFKVISGLDSVVIGEYQIQGQVKEAYSIACQVKTVDKVLHKLFHAAFRCGKLVRNSTSIGKGRFSVAGIAADIVLNFINDDSCVAIVGVNENTRIIAEELAEHNFKNIIFINRTLHKAQFLAEKYGGMAVPLTELGAVLKDADILFTSTSSQVPLLTASEINNAFSLYAKPKLILDLAIPRDVEAENLNDKIDYYDIERLKDFLDKQQKSKLEEIPICEKIIKNEVEAFLAWQESSGDEIFEPFEEKFERIRRELLDEYVNLLNPADFEKVEKITKQLLHRTKAVFLSILKEKNNLNQSKNK